MILYVVGQPIERKRKSFFNKTVRFDNDNIINSLTIPEVLWAFENKESALSYANLLTQREYEIAPGTDGQADPSRETLSIAPVITIEVDDNFELGDSIQSSVKSALSMKAKVSGFEYGPKYGAGVEVSEENVLSEETATENLIDTILSRKNLSFEHYEVRWDALRDGAQFMEASFAERFNIPVQDLQEQPSNGCSVS